MGGQYSGLSKYDFEAGSFEQDPEVKPEFSRPLEKMEAEYVGHYLGNSMLTKGTTGLGVIQKPLRDKYFSFRKSSENKIGPEIGIRINPRGIILLFPGGHHGEPHEEFYDISTIHFIDAVQFVTVKQKDKKFSGAFLPIDEDEPIPNQDKLFVPIEKKFIHLTKISHPPMLACVMRRPTGIKAVDCHMFVIPVVEDALRMADMIHRFQERPDYGRPPPDRFDLPPDHRDYPPGRRDMYPGPDVIPRSMGPPRDHDPRDPRGPRDSDDGTYLYKGRGFELKQEHFTRGNDEDDRRYDLNRSSERDGRDEPQRYPPPMRGRPDSLEFRDRDRPPPRERDRDMNVDRRPREFTTPSGRYVERDSFGSEHEFDNRIVHERQRSGGDRDYDRYSGGLSPRGEYPERSSDRRGAMSPRNNYPDRPNLPPRGPDNYPGRYPDLSPDHRRGGAPPPWQGRGPNDDARMYRGDYRDQPPRSPPSGPRGRSPPRLNSPPRGHSSPRAQSPERDDTVYSASNLESRLDETQGGKPVAKVPPNRHVGVRVLPSLPVPGAKNILKPVSPRTSDAPKLEEEPPTYNFNTKPDYDDDDANPYDNATDGRHLQRQNRAKSESSPLVHRRAEYNHNSRVKSDDYGHNYRNEFDNKQPSKPWTFDEEKEKFLLSRDSGGGKGWSSANKSKSANAGFEGPGPGRHSKDLEIEEMFSYLDTNSARNDVDFERSLGYLP